MVFLFYAEPAFRTILYKYLTWGIIILKLLEAIS